MSLQIQMYVASLIFAFFYVVKLERKKKEKKGRDQEKKNLLSIRKRFKISVIEKN